MEIKNLYDRIQRQVKDNSFQISKNSTDIEEFERLCSVFELNSIWLNDFSCFLQEDILRFSGKFSISSLYSEMEMNIAVDSKGQMNAVISADKLSIDYENIFCAENCSVEIIMNEGENDFSEKIRGNINFGNIEFLIFSQRNNILSKRKFILQYKQEINVIDFIDSILAPLNINLSVFDIDKTKMFNIEKLEFTYTAPSCWLTPTEQSQHDFDDCFSLDVKTNIGFRFNKIGLNDVGFLVEKYGSEYDLSLYGQLNIFNKNIPFFICYNGNLFSVSASQCGEVRLTDIEDMGIITGENNVADNFPDDIVLSGEIKLHTLNFVISSDFKNVQNFTIAVLLDCKWQLCGSPKIDVSNILISFNYTPTEKIFALSGTINFCGVDTQLCAGIIKGQTKNTRWLFSWRMFDYETISLTKLIRGLAETLGANPTSIKMPEIEIGHVAVEYIDRAFSIKAYIILSESKLFSSETKLSLKSEIKGGKRDFNANFCWKSKNNSLTVENILIECGVESNINEIPECIRNIYISSVDLSYDFIDSEIRASIEISKVGKLNFDIVFGKEKSYYVAYRPQIENLSFSHLPVVGKLVEKYLPNANDFSVSNIVVHSLSKPDLNKNIPAGIRITFQIMGEDTFCQLYEKKFNKFYEVSCEGFNEGLYLGNSTVKTVWINVEKTVAIFSLHRIGVGLDGSYFMLVLDASLNVSPLTFTLLGAGIGVNFSDLSDLKFYISGFAISFKNNIVSISGEFRKSDEKYAGALLISVKQISATAIAEYSESGCLMAYAVVCANFGGPPALFIKGISFGFGYNKRLILPDIDSVVDYPLISAAKGILSQNDMAASLDKYIKDECGQKFLAAGVKFTSFEIVDSIAVLTVAFERNFEIGILGVSDITMPPKCSKNPIAHAQLALKVSVKPDSGFFGIEARLTSESYILSRNCKLTGGFAFYCWFGGEYKGDMVITLGGYKAGYNKPRHYPDVPRVGFDWSIGNLKMNGEMYFALTPKEVMAGGRLNAVYTLGNLKAYFIAAADFYLGWKPFHYDASINVLVGVSYRIDCWLVHHTFKVELGAGLHIWGPDFTGTAHISWFIISFDINFGSNASKDIKDLNWSEFTDSFLPKKDEVKNKKLVVNDENKQAAPLIVSFSSGVVSNNEKVTICRADDLQINVESAIPVTSIFVNGIEEKYTVNQQEIRIRPMGDAKIENDFIVEFSDESNHKIDVCTSFVKQNIPAALWGAKNYEASLVKDVVCGVLIKPSDTDYKLFPVKRFISLEQLYLNGTIKIPDAFEYISVSKYPLYYSEGTIEIFGETVNSYNVQENRKKLLKSMGISIDKDISLKKFAENAENLFSENILISKR